MMGRFGAEKGSKEFGIFLKAANQPMETKI
ncbi:hypothetical protein X732_09395 [Mesorhizobium sp. L2C066B000]|nr:hypothetical protein X732_09395 [Mesorhizobium sp. L2C066B000]